MCDVNINGMPLVIVTFGSVYKNETDVYDVTNELEKIYNRREKFCLLMDLSKVEHVNLNLIAKLIMWFLKKKELSDKYLICTCLLITNPKIYNLIQTSLKFVKTTKPYFVMKNKSQWYTYAMIVTVWTAAVDPVDPVPLPTFP